MTVDGNTRALEDGIVTDFSRRMSYGSYLALDELLAAQRPQSVPVSTTTRCCSSSSTRPRELWLKLLLHELRAAERVARDCDDLRDGAEAHRPRASTSRRR